MTFHGHDARGPCRPTSTRTRARSVMLVPLAVLGARRGRRRLRRSSTSSSARATAEFWGKALFEGARQPHPARACTRSRTGCGWAPTIAMLGGFAARLHLLHAAPSLPAATARVFRPLYLFLLNKWYFDELYDWLFVRPAFWLGRLLWKGGDGTIIDGLAPTASPTACCGPPARVVRLQTGYVYHYAFAMLVGVALIVTAFMFCGGAGADGSPASAASVAHHLLAAGRRAHHRCLNPRRQGQRALDRALHDALHLRRRRCILWAKFDPSNAGFQFVEETDWLGGSISYKMGVDGISVLFVVLTAFLMPLVHPGELGVDRGPRQGVHDRLPGAGDADDRRLLRARPRAVLPVLRGRPDPDVPDHRHLGRPAARLRQLQVLPLHAARLGADAARHDGDVLARRHHRHPDAADATSSRRTCSGGCGSPSSPRSR